MGKVDAPLNEKLKNVEWGEYRIGDLFESSNGNFDIQKKHINEKGDYVVTAGLTDYGILGKSDIPANIFDENTITIDMFGNAFFRSFKYKMVTHARVFSLKPKLKITKYQGIFLSTSFNFLDKKFGYENMCSWIKIKDEVIQLPTKNKEIDFEFMEKFIAELEAKHIAELEAYLAITGLENYELTEKEKFALNKLNAIEWGEYKIGDLFFIKSSKKIFHANYIKIYEKKIENSYPYVVRKTQDNGIRGYIKESEKYLNDANTLSFAQDTFSVFYQKIPFFTGNKVKILYPKTKKFNEKIADFIISVFNVRLSQMTWGTGSTTKTISEIDFKLPTKNKEIDFEFIENFISAIEKLVIKDVVKYAKKNKDIINQVIKNSQK
ncbi:restriction endonuclease subunit S [Campylobacter sp. 1569]|nr:restriction endonuclease subunit S [Campylobacter sp. 1569]